MTKNVKALWVQICNTVLQDKPDNIKLLLDWKDAEQADLKEALSACQLQNETTQAALERSRESDAAQLSATGAMQIERDALITALRDVLGWYSTATIASAMSELGEQSDYHRTLNQARKALRATNVSRELATR